MSNSPYREKSAEEVSAEIQEDVVAGIVTVSQEQYEYDSGSGDTYTILCGMPNIANGVLVEVNRIWGIDGDSFKEFILNTDFTTDTDNNQITFTNPPDDGTHFYVSYRFDSGIVSGITNIQYGSVTRTLIDAFSRQLSAVYRTGSLIKASMYIDTAVGSDLDDLLALVNVKRLKAVAATGYVTFYRDTGGDIETVPAGTNMSADKDDGPVVYVSTETTTFAQGFTTCRAAIKATDTYKGKIGNVAPNRITKILSTGVVATRVSNPAYYTDYEFISLIEGNYAYSLLSAPRRVINSNTYPFAVTDKGCVIVNRWSDQSINDTNWTTSNVTLSEGIPETGHTKAEPVAADDYIEIDVTVDWDMYKDIYVMTRGLSGQTFGVQVNAVTVSMYPFGSISSSTTPTLATNMTLYVGSHGAAGTSAKTCKLVFGSSNTAWIDLIGIGDHIVEDPSGSLSTFDEFSVNYAAKRVNLYYQDETSNFFTQYDGDPTDGYQDQLYFYYQWDNNIAGGGDVEDDDNYRDRGRNALAIAAKGTKDAIRSAVLGVEGINQCEVSDYNDDSTIDPGIVHVYVLAQGFTVSPSLNQDIVDAVDSARAAGIYAKIFAPQVRYVNFAMTVVYDDGIIDYLGADGQTSLKTIIISAINDFFDDAHINEALFMSDLEGYIVSEVPGILAAAIEWDGANVPTYSDDNYTGSYTWSGTVMIESNDTRRVTGVKANATMVIQAGNTVSSSALTLLRKSDYQ